MGAPGDQSPSGAPFVLAITLKIMKLKITILSIIILTILTLVYAAEPITSNLASVAQPQTTTANMTIAANISSTSTTMPATLTKNISNDSIYLSPELLAPPQLMDGCFSFEDDKYKGDNPDLLYLNIGSARVGLIGEVVNGSTCLIRNRRIKKDGEIYTKAGDNKETAPTIKEGDKTYTTYFLKPGKVIFLVYTDKIWNVEWKN